MLLGVRLLCPHPPTEKGLRAAGELNIAAAVTGQTPRAPSPPLSWEHDECVPRAWVMVGWTDASAHVHATPHDTKNRKVISECQSRERARVCEMMEMSESLLMLN